MLIKGGIYISSLEIISVQRPHLIWRLCQKIMRRYHPHDSLAPVATDHINHVSLLVVDQGGRATFVGWNISAAKAVIQHSNFAET